jgi:hypothetical protein
MSTTTLHNIARQVRFYPHEIGGAIGWALLDLGDWLQEVAYRVSGGETPEPGVPDTRHLQWIADRSGRKVSEIVRDMEGAR